MGSCRSRIDDIWECYEKFCAELGEETKSDSEAKTHAEELVKKYKIEERLWWM